MIVGLDAQLSPAMAPWLCERFGVDALSLQRLGLRDAEDQEIFEKAREAKAVVITKDSDFVKLVERHGPPPQIVLLTLGNTSNARLRAVFERNWTQVAQLLTAGEPLIEIGG